MPFLAALAGFSLIATGPAGGTVWQGAIPPAKRASVVYLPPQVSPVARYPVVYLLHGMPGSPQSFVGALRLARVADELGTPFVAVAPVAGPTASYGGEWAGRWERYLVRDVIPWVDANLPVGSRAIAGLSAGGYGAVDIALRHPGLFDTVESWGGYFVPFRDGPLARDDASELAAHDPELLVRHEAPAFRRVRFFLSSGPTHGDIRRRATSVFGAELAALRIPHTVLLLHTRKADWRDQLIAGLRYALEPATS